MNIFTNFNDFISIAYKASIDVQKFSLYINNFVYYFLCHYWFTIKFRKIFSKLYVYSNNISSGGQLAHNLMNFIFPII